MPVGLLAAGEKAQVLEIAQKKSFAAPEVKNEQNLCARIEDMGLRAGQTVEMLSNEGKGPILLKVDNSRIAIDRSMAMKIMVAIVRR